VVEARFRPAEIAKYSGKSAIHHQATYLHIRIC
jgi:hypothetical protein